MSVLQILQHFRCRKYVCPNPNSTSDIQIFQLLLIIALYIDDLLQYFSFFCRTPTESVFFETPIELEITIV